ncbi:MAG TPA: GyrI-like domain-containing protein [Longimicrobiaceae bacterium]|nr:GyrI-like domain-containing protein [Longimicrobiaceae bacterium]
MLLAGLRLMHTFAGGAETTPAQWAEFRELGRLPGQQGTTAYGVICSGSPETQTFEYMTGVEVASFDTVPPSLGRMRIHPQRYAVFEHRAHVSTIWTTWKGIWHEWLPRSGHEGENAPDFEVYDERFDPTTGTGEIEVWFPVKVP